MKRIEIILLVLAVMAGGCRQSRPMTEVNIERPPEITPDYKNVTIPVNIAPLNFIVTEEGEEVSVSIKGRKGVSELSFKGYKVIFPEKKWAALLYENKGDSIEIQVSILKNDSLMKFKPFKVYISSDPADGYLAYRLLLPGFQNWNQMGIYQREISSFKEETITDSRIMPGTCMNCHSFALNDPDNMVMHLREVFGGTILYQDKKVRMLNTKTEKMFGSAAFPFWHPSKKYIAFSVNRVSQVFHAVGPHRAAAVDLKSDVFVYDIAGNEMLTSPVLSSDNSFETFPCFSPDGMTLYFCTADSMQMPQKFDKILYSLCSVSFDPVTGSFGERIDTIISGPAIGKSISIPRVSPDGRYLMFNISDYGCFPSFNPEADIYLLDLVKGGYRPLNAINSDEVDSWHSWSSNGRWVAFSSRRENGLHSNVYLAYIDEEGNPCKPFILPQKDPAFYVSFLFSYNVPEFIKSRVTANPYDIEKIAKKTPGVQVQSGSGH